MDVDAESMITGSRREREAEGKSKQENKQVQEEDDDDDDVLLPGGKEWAALNHDQRPLPESCKTETLKVTLT